MLRLYVLLILLTHRIRTAYVTGQPSLAERLDKIYERLEKFTITPLDSVEVTKSPREKLYEKLEKLNSLRPSTLSENDEELISTMQHWGRLSAEQLDEVVKDLQSVREEDDSVDYGDGVADAEWSEEDLQDIGEDYPMDDLYNDEEAEPAAATKPIGVTPSAFTRQDAEYRELVVSAADPIAATNERPQILNSSSLSPKEHAALRRAIFENMAAVMRTSKCREPQPRWLNIRQLAPAANIVYMPPCVKLHRCAADSGCCHDETKVCAPVAGTHIVVPVYLQKANGMEPAQMRFFNHTQCACVSQETLQSTVRTRVESQQKRESQYRRESQSDYRTAEYKTQVDFRPQTVEPDLERDEPTAPPQLRRCTCPALFMAKITDKSNCSCVCEWPELSRKRDCLYMARGREHFGLRDRVCVINGDCTPPTCEFGAFERSIGRCPPLKRLRRIRYHHHGRRLLLDKSIEV